MFSNSNNVETIGQLIEELKRYVELKGNFLKLDIIERLVRLITAGVLVVIISVLFLAMLFYMTLCLAYAIIPYLGAVATFGIFAATSLVILILTILLRKLCIEKPLVKFLAKLLLD